MIMIMIEIEHFGGHDFWMLRFSSPCGVVCLFVFVQNRGFEVDLAGRVSCVVKCYCVGDRTTGKVEAEIDGKNELFG